MSFRVFLVVVFVGAMSLNIHAQRSALESLIPKKTIEQSTTIGQLFQNIESSSNITFSYASNQIDPSESVSLEITSSFVSIKELLENVFNHKNLEIKVINNKIILQVEPQKIRLYGIIKDKNSGEVLPGAVLVDNRTQKVYTTDNNGFYSLVFDSDSSEIEVRYLGYNPTTVHVTNSGRNLHKDISMVFKNQIETITIKKNVSDNLLIDPGGELVFSTQPYLNKGLTGTTDALENIKTIEGATSGAEGVTGLYINGGNSDENLIQLEGMPIYEVSHIAGIHSIFIDETIRSVNIIKTGIPARFGGRLSSVINFNLKEGHSQSIKKSLNIGLGSAQFSANGPLHMNGKTTFNLAARASLFNFTFKPIITSLSNFRDLSLSYYDAVCKVTHKFSNNEKISLTTYLGQDRIRLFKNDTIVSPTSYFSSRDINELKWGNTLLSLNYQKIISSSAILKAHVGWNKYSYFSRGYYELYSKFDTIELDKTIDVKTFSDIQDLKGSVSMDYYFNEILKSKIGVTYTQHTFNPTIRQSLLKDKGDTTSFNNPGNALRAYQASIFAELNIRLKNNLYFYPGLHINNFDVQGTDHTTLQPRLKLLWVPDNFTTIGISYSRLAQNIRLLSNPGLGIASDLWVPSLSHIKPTLVDQFDFEIKRYLLKDLAISATLYTKNYKNLLDYSLPVDLHANVIIQNQEGVFFNQSTTWDEHIEIGQGYSRGYTIGITKETGKTKGWVRYHRNSAKRKFANLNEGTYFSSKNERPHDINIAINRNITSKLWLGLQWVYTSGGTFSLPNEEFSSSLGIKILRPDGRNNYRLPSFHQLSISGEYSFNSKFGKHSFNFGIYNAYNRLNPFYLYATNTPNSSIPVIKKVSIFPTVPFLSLTTTW